MNRYMRSAVIAFSVRNRNRKAAFIQEFMAKHAVENVVFVGCSPGANRNEQIVENAIADKAKVLGACDVLMCQTPWPFALADGRKLPFSDKSTDMVVANAVIEHVGGLLEQAQFVSEQTRVGKTWVITTPNRWFPVESHTATVFKHWRTAWRDEQGEFTRLLSKREFRDLLPANAKVYGRPWSATFLATWSST